MMLRQATVSLMAFTVLVGFVPIANAGTFLVDNFNDGNDDGWSLLDDRTVGIGGPATLDASSRAYHIGTTGVVTQFGAIAGSYWDASSGPLFSNGVWRTTVRADNDGTEIGLTLRFDPSNTMGYVFGLDPTTGGGEFIRTDGGPPFSRNELFSLPGMTFRGGEDWIMEVGTIDDELTFKAWPVGEPEPASPQQTFTDSTYSTGMFGVGFFAYPGFQGSATFDDISFTPIPPLPPGVLDNPGLGGNLPPGLQNGLPSPLQSVPEPVSGTLLLLGSSICVMMNRRKRT